MPRIVRVGLVQQAATDDRSRNVEEAVSGIREAKAQGADLVCLPELFAGPYFCQVEDPGEFDRAEPLDGPTVACLARAAEELDVDVLCSVFERRSPGVYHNTLVHLGADAQRRAVYRKMHIPDDPQFQEKYYFTPGDLGFVTSRSGDARLGLLVCWDQWFPEAARLSSLAGAEILFYPTAIGWMPEEPEDHEDQLSAWRTIQRSHAIANGVFVVAVNRVGTETSAAGSITFWGHSFVCAPNGRVLCQAATEPCVLVAECDLDQIEKQRRVWPFFRDRRIDAYQGLLERWGTGE
jgi:N-carbamoylputrescine amidase